MYDPFGYYKDKNIYSLDKNENVPFYEDFPMNDNQWFIGESAVGISKDPDNFLNSPVLKEKLENNIAKSSILPE